MNKKDNEQNLSRIKKSLFVLAVIIVALGILIYSISNTISKERRLPTLQISKKDLAVRGDILSSDGYKIATSKKIYTASIDTRSLDKNKKELFVKLFSIYSNIEEKVLMKKINKSYEKPGSLTLSRVISSRDAKNLKFLAYKLRKLKVFKSIKKNGARILYGLSLYETGERRLSPYNDTLTPVIGYVKEDDNKKGILKANGLKGLEKSYNETLNRVRDGELSGERDAASYIIFNKDSIIKSRKDGQTLKLYIPLKLQKNIEMMLDKYKAKLEADEIIVSIMESKTGKVISLATSNRFNPNYKKKKTDDVPNLNVNAIEQTFEPGSVVKPIAISLVLDKHRVTLDELIFAHNKSTKNKKGEYKKGKIKIGRWTINDDHQFKKNYITVRDIMVHSSNIGTLQLAQRLKAYEILQGYKKFGITEKTGIDLPYEKIGKLPTIYQLSAGEDKGKSNVFKATISYGQGMRASFMQILRAYSVFNNEGKIVTPMIVQQNFINPPTHVISKSTAKIMKDLLIKTVDEGTGRKARYDGLEIGGKTGTANIARGGNYKRKYMSSFFGFANDNNTSYTIGVTVNNPVSTGKHWYYYYASNSAVPVFKEMVDILVKLNKLKPNVGIIQKN